MCEGYCTLATRITGVIMYFVGLFPLPLPVALIDLSPSKSSVIVIAPPETVNS